MTGSFHLAYFQGSFLLYHVSVCVFLMPSIALLYATFSLFIICWIFGLCPNFISVAGIKYPGKKATQGKKGLIWLTVPGSVHESRELMMTGTYISHPQWRAERNAWCYLLAAYLAFSPVLHSSGASAQGRMLLTMGWSSYLFELTRHFPQTCPQTNFIRHFRWF